MIYAIRAGEAGPIKFGKTKNRDARVHDLQVGNHEALRVLALAGVHDQVEKLIHRHLREERVRGEWFRPTERAMALVEVMKKQEGSRDHEVTNHIYDNDFAAVVWFRSRYLGFEVFEEEVSRAKAEGINFRRVLRTGAIPPVGRAML